MHCRSLHKLNSKYATRQGDLPLSAAEGSRGVTSTVADFWFHFILRFHSFGRVYARVRCFSAHSGGSWADLPPLFALTLTLASLPQRCLLLIPLSLLLSVFLLKKKRQQESSFFSDFLLLLLFVAFASSFAFSTRRSLFHVGSTLHNQFSIILKTCRRGSPRPPWAPAWAAA
jgi:hypothetical protein